MAKNQQLTVNLLVPGQQFGTDFYIRAVVEVESFGTPKTGRDPRWSVAEYPELFLDCGGNGESVVAGPEFADALAYFVTTNLEMIEQVESAIADIRKDDRKTRE